MLNASCNKFPEWMGAFLNIFVAKVMSGSRPRSAKADISDKILDLQLSETSAFFACHTTSYLLHIYIGSLHGGYSNMA